MMMTTSFRWIALSTLGALATFSAPALAAGGETSSPTAAPPTVTASPVPATPPAVPAPPYSLPWQLRPAGPATVVRSDTSVAFYDGTAGQAGSTVATMLLASAKVTPTLAPLLRVGFVQNDAPGATPDGTSVVNPLLGLTWGRRWGGMRVAAFAAGTVPVGQGGGDKPDAGASTANTAGLRARSGMDNAMFAVNYFAAIGGADVAYVDHDLTVQAEVTLFELMRVRGEHAAGSMDGTRTNSTAGLHVGYFLFSKLSLGGELRYQRWLSTPTQLVMGNRVDISDAAKDTLTVAAGPRLHLPLGHGMVFRPGVSYAQGLDQPLSSASYHMVQVDLPISF
jgi:hypothetical protein